MGKKELSVAREAAGAHRAGQQSIMMLQDADTPGSELNSHKDEVGT